jgi:hypothetical protein
MAEKHKKIVLTVKQKLKLIKNFEFGESDRISQRLWDRDTNHVT